MTWPTHTMFGISTLWLVALVPPEIVQANMGVLAAASALGALMPDLDASESRIKHLKIPNTQIKPFMMPVMIVSRSDQRHGLMHSLIGLSMMAVFVLPFAFCTGRAVGVTFLLGYASHLVANSATKSGIHLLYPKNHRFHLLPVRWRFTTDSLAEDVLLAPLVFSVFLLLLLR